MPAPAVLGDPNNQMSFLDSMPEEFRQKIKGALLSKKLLGNPNQPILNSPHGTTPVFPEAPPTGPQSLEETLAVAQKKRRAKELLEKFGLADVAQGLFADPNAPMPMMDPNAPPPMMDPNAI